MEHRSPVSQNAETQSIDYSTQSRQPGMNHHALTRDRIELITAAPSRAKFTEAGGVGPVRTRGAVLEYCTRDPTPARTNNSGLLRRLFSVWLSGNKQTLLISSRPERGSFGLQEYPPAACSVSCCSAYRAPLDIGRSGAHQLSSATLHYASTIGVAS